MRRRLQLWGMKPEQTSPFGPHPPAPSPSGRRGDPKGNLTPRPPLHCVERGRTELGTGVRGRLRAGPLSDALKIWTDGQKQISGLGLSEAGVGLVDAYWTGCTPGPEISARRDIAAGSSSHRRPGWRRTDGRNPHRSTETRTSPPNPLS